ncbi:MAG: potassium channel protein [Desulfobacterales bacterium]|nr:potassium channel protein [Desulfobacterales bacterium]
MERSANLLLTILLAVILVAIGTAGYMLIEDWPMLDSVYMTVITLSTIGYGEVNPVSQPGRIFTLILIVMGVGFFLYVIGNVVQFLVEGRIRLILGRHKLDKQINQLNNHYIICGYGRMGRAFCRYLIQRGLKFVVLEKSDERVPVMNTDHVLYVTGEATVEENLLKAGIKRASNLIATLGTDADNVLLVLLAKGLNPGLYVVARASQNASKKPLDTAGADVVVSPYDVGARRIAHAILRPNVIRFLEYAFADESTDIHIEELPVSENSRLVGVSLKDSGIRHLHNLNILSIIEEDGDMLFNPSADTKLRAGESVIAVGTMRDLKRMEELLNP